MGSIDEFVATGAFDADRVADADGGGGLGPVVVRGTRLAGGGEDPAELLRSREQPAPVRAVVTTLDRHGAVGFDGMSVGDGADAPWVAFGLAEGTGWELLAVWAFASSDEAEAAQAELAEVLGNESRIGDLISGDPVELLEREGPTLWLRAPLTGETYRWRTLRTSFDPAMLPLAGGND